MRTLLRGISVVVLTALWTGAGWAQSQTPSPAPQISYADFVKLDYAARRQRFGEVNAATKAAIMRSHLADWLGKNRSRLSASQVEVVQDAIAFVTPALYESPTDPAVTARSKELEARLACKLRRSDIMTAFKPSDPPMAATWLEDFSSWFTACVLGG